MERDTSITSSCVTLTVITLFFFQNFKNISFILQRSLFVSNQIFPIRVTFTVPFLSFCAKAQSILFAHWWYCMNNQKIFIGRSYECLINKIDNKIVCNTLNMSEIISSYTYQTIVVSSNKSLKSCCVYPRAPIFWAPEGCRR